MKQDWRKASAGKAHLATKPLGTALASRGHAAWCGMDLTRSIEAPHADRCKDCVRAVQEFADSVATPPPPLIEERFVFTVTRPASSDEVIDVLRRRLAALTSWKWSLATGGHVMLHDGSSMKAPRA